MPRWSVLVAVVGIGCGGGHARSSPPAQQQTPPAPIIDVAVDSDHDGAVTAADEAAENEGQQAIFLANLDDDDSDGKPDADDEVVNGPQDILDLAPGEVRAWPDAPDDASGILRIDAVRGAIRVFRIDGDPADPSSYTAEPNGLDLTAADLRSGVHLAVEGLALLQSTQPDSWDGTAGLTLIVTRGAETFTDKATLRVAPVLFQPNTALPRDVFYSGGEPFNAAFAAALRADLQPTGITVDELLLPGTFADWDPWAQDFFDVAHAARPGPGGKPQEMLFMVRSAQPDRVAGGIVEKALGPDVGTIFIHDPAGPAGDQAYSMNSFGNWDVIPPYSGWPLGRNLWGAGPTDATRPDPVYSDFVRAQKVQGFINIDTSFLLVGHVDEIVSFVPSDDQRGFRLLAASPSMARQMLTDLKAQGHGDAILFQGKNWLDSSTGQEYPAAISVDAVLANAELMAASQESQIRTDEAVAILTQAVGIPAEEVIPMPALFESVVGYMLAYQPGTVNLLPVGKRLVLADPFGPIIDGKDPFRVDLEDRLGSLGYDLEFVDDWDIYHREEGEVHCATNANRDMNVAFWEVQP